jgi:hypothetical protein
MSTGAQQSRATAVGLVSAGCVLRDSCLPHVLELESNELSLELQRESHLQLVLPETPGFLKDDLSGDPAAALAKAEGGHS